MFHSIFLCWTKTSLQVNIHPQQLLTNPMIVFLRNCGQLFCARYDIVLHHSIGFRLFCLDVAVLKLIFLAWKSTKMSVFVDNVTHLSKINERHYPIQLIEQTLLYILSLSIHHPSRDQFAQIRTMQIHWFFFSLVTKQNKTSYSFDSLCNIFDRSKQITHFQQQWSISWILIFFFFSFSCLYMKTCRYILLSYIFFPCLRTSSSVFIWTQRISRLDIHSFILFILIYSYIPC